MPLLSEVYFFFQLPAKEGAKMRVGVSMDSEHIDWLCLYKGALLILQATMLAVRAVQDFKPSPFIPRPLDAWNQMCQMGKLPLFKDYCISVSVPFVSQCNDGHSICIINYQGFPEQVLFLRVGLGTATGSIWVNGKEESKESAFSLIFNVVQLLLKANEGNPTREESMLNILAQFSMQENIASLAPSRENTGSYFEVFLQSVDTELTFLVKHQCGSLNLNFSSAQQIILNLVELLALALFSTKAAQAFCSFCAQGIIPSFIEFDISAQNSHTHNSHLVHPIKRVRAWLRGPWKILHIALARGKIIVCEQNYNQSTAKQAICCVNSVIQLCEKILQGEDRCKVSALDEILYYANIDHVPNTQAHNFSLPPELVEAESDNHWLA